ncbi:MAG: FAD-dependent oxidoreductase [Actinomycetota bacterium]|nr:FAD-dependent oxidoreductase [Actinomycetota bacterium]
MTASLDEQAESAAAKDGLLAVDGGVWDLLVIGGGTAGLVAARTAASFRASVLLVERDRTGGDCLWTGCVPSKALLAAASAAADARTAGRLGVHVDARFTGGDSAEVDGRPVRFRQALIATGSNPLVPRFLVCARRTR